MQSFPKSSKPAPADPQETAIAVLAWLASEPEMLSRFLALSGIEPGQMRGAVNDPGFLAGMLDFLMAHEPTLMAFCAATETLPETVVASWQHFSGPGLDSGVF
ncbi:DUF3572 domain-containing protein [Rhizobiaceae bacterium n13]|uniref:DUF3572 domain-containing protein n=1 Tax=Ferirhizobium litorale TaxID=2927786 RepID=A0AAE3QGQ0_9HYPH|nr:DUF3572 domain-containing protein [Fererhizobium litorale]MDI7864380.1 DUF3572 domain-containing protein [Fererhizobium litorale]MDI7924706.1 DUF3572 domain-containing protein [Fererhizobium litorale]